MRVDRTRTSTVEADHVGLAVVEVERDEVSWRGGLNQLICCRAPQAKCRGLTLSDVSVEEVDVEQVGEVDFECELSGPSCLCYAFECPDDGISRRFLVVVVVRDDSVELHEDVGRVERGWR